MNKLHEFDQALSGLNSELASFIASLIEQNAELAEKLQHLDSLTELAEKTVIEASKEAKAIMVAAEREANHRSAISCAVEVRPEAASENAITENSKDEEEVLSLREDTKQLLALVLRSARSPVEVSRELYAELEYGKTNKTTFDIPLEDPLHDSLFAEQEGEPTESLAYYADFVDMVLPPPMALGGMLKLYKQLNKYPGVKVIAVEYSLANGLWIRLIVRTNTPLLNIFETLYEVDRLSYAVTEVGKVYSAQR